jgi:hypothetical protein
MMIENYMKETFLVYFKALSQHLYEATETNEKPQSDCRV